MPDTNYIAGISTIEATLKYAVEETAGTRPTSGYTQLHRINSIDSITIEPEQIDASALEDAIERNIAGRASAGGSFNVVVNLTDQTLTEWETLLTAYATAKAAGKAVWFEVKPKGLEKAFFVAAEPPTKIPMPEFGQNSLLTVSIPLTINQFEGALAASTV